LPNVVAVAAVDEADLVVAVLAVEAADLTAVDMEEDLTGVDMAAVSEGNAAGSLLLPEEKDLVSGATLTAAVKVLAAWVPAAGEKAAEHLRAVRRVDLPVAMQHVKELAELGVRLDSMAGSPTGQKPLGPEASELGDHSLVITDSL
jgi:hypothetical protein